MSVAAVLPARDEAGSVGLVVERLIAAVPGIHVVVVDDRSQDGTADIARAAGATVLRSPRPGYGHAARAGTDAARGADIYLYLDADGSMPPEEAPLLLAAVEAGSADLVAGRRVVSAAVMPWHQRAGNRVIAALLRRQGIHLGELGPFRAVRAALLDDIDLPGSRFAWHAEMLVRVAARGGRIEEAAVGCAPRIAGRSKVGGSVRGSVLATWDIGRALTAGRP